jgi:hypothetical protein
MTNGTFTVSDINNASAAKALHIDAPKAKAVLIFRVAGGKKQQAG